MPPRVPESCSWWGAAGGGTSGRCGSALSRERLRHNCGQGSDDSCSTHAQAGGEPKPRRRVKIAPCRRLNVHTSAGCPAVGHRWQGHRGTGDATSYRHCRAAPEKKGLKKENLLTGWTKIKNTGSWQIKHMVFSTSEESPLATPSIQAVPLPVPVHRKAQHWFQKEMLRAHFSPKSSHRDNWKPKISPLIAHMELDCASLE